MEASFLEIRSRGEFLVVHNIVQLAHFSGLVAGTASSPKTGIVSYMLVFKDGSLLSAIVTDPRRGLAWTGDYAVERFVKYIMEGDAIYQEVLVELGEIPILLASTGRTESQKTLPVRLLEPSLEPGVILHSRMDELSATLSNPMILASLLLQAKYYARRKIPLDQVSTVLSEESLKVAPSMLYAKTEGRCTARFLAFNGIIFAGAVESEGAVIYGRKSLEVLAECGKELVLSLYRIEAEVLGKEYVGAVEEVARLSEEATVKALESRLSLLMESLGLKGSEAKLVSVSEEAVVVNVKIPETLEAFKQKMLKKLLARVLEDKVRGYMGGIPGKELKVAVS